MTILLHSSKTMKIAQQKIIPLTTPLLIDKAEQLARYLKSLSPKQLAEHMHLSAALADKTHALLAAWTSKPEKQTIAIDSFIGDIYSGLHASDLSIHDRDYANSVLFILSGLYGCIRPYDGIYPYRLEMAYRFPKPRFSNLYTYWGDAIAACLPKHGPIINVSSVEYTKVVLPYIDSSRVIEPKFLTVNPETGKPAFVVVHAKIARGAFARWLITNRIKDVTKLLEFTELGYTFEKKFSVSNTPTFICKEFGGKGLSIRLAA